MLRVVMRWVWRLFLAASVLMLITFGWLAAGGPTYIDRWLNVTEPPVPSEAIVVLAGGTNGANLPLSQGWDRLNAAANLYIDGLAPTIIFSGGGTSRVAEAEIYANAAAWLGVPRSAMLLETKAQGTADHGAATLDVELPGGRAITTSTPLLVVTSAFHSRRALYSFHRAGFTSVRMVSTYRSTYRARLGDAAPPGGAAPVELPAGAPAALTSTVPTHQPSGKQYNDVLFRLAHRSFDLFIGLREVGAIWLM